MTADETAPSPLAGVYFARAGDAVKIGVSRNVRRRVQMLSTCSPFPIQLLAVMPGGIQDERALHRRFAHLRMNGEWFRPDSELLDFIATLPPVAATPKREPNLTSGRKRMILNPEQKELLARAVSAAQELRALKSEMWDGALAARKAGVSDELITAQTGLSRATMNRRYGPRRELGV